MSERSTPLTDEASFSTVIQGELVKASFARRLETDRAALMEALEQTLDAWELGYKTTECHEPENARRALAAARANFPTP